MSRKLLSALACLLTMTTILVGTLASPAAAAGPAWWNASYSDRLAINVHANDAITTGYSLDVIINHARMVSQGFSMASGDDVRIAYYNGSTWTELDRVLAYGSSWNNAATDLVFKTQAPVNANTDDTGYYLYYGNAAAATPPANANNVYALFDDFSSGSIDSSKWIVNTQPGLAVDVNNGQLRVSGTSQDATKYLGSGIQTVATFDNSYRTQASFSILSQSTTEQVRWGSTFGVPSSAVYIDRGSGGVAYYDGGTGLSRKIADTTLTGQTFTNQRVSATAFPNATSTLTENSVLVARRVNLPAYSGATVRWQFVPSTANETYDVRYDDLVIRKVVNNEPMVSIEGATDIAFVTTVAPVFSFTVAIHASGACNGATQTSGASTTGSSVSMGHVSVSNPSVAVQDLSVTSNANAGFTVGVRSPALLSAGSNTIVAVPGTNASPAVFGASAGFGYTTNALSRFTSKWAGLTSTSSEVLSGTVPTTSAACVAYQLQVAASTPAASYSGSLIYSAVPTF